MSWDSENGKIEALTNTFADAFSPAWDRDKKHLYFLASTNTALGSGWANTSSIQAEPSYAAYVMVLRNDEDSPFIPESDEEKVKKEKEEGDEDEEDKGEDAGAEKKDEEAKDDKNGKAEEEKDEGVRIDFDGRERRIIALPGDRGNLSLIHV